MLVAYLGSSPRSEQFVREFLDRRHTCWQLHRKRVEEMQSDSKLKKSQNDQQPSSAPTNNEGNLHSSNAYSEANDSHAENVVCYLGFEGLTFCVVFLRNLSSRITSFLLAMGVASHLVVIFQPLTPIGLIV